MSKRVVLIALVLFVAASCFAQQVEKKAVELRTEKLADSLYQVSGDGGNMAFLVTNDGVLLVDASTKAIAPEIAAAVKAVSDKPVKYVFLTHYHHDHIGSVPELSKTATVISHENVRKRLSADQRVMGTDVKARPAGSWSTMTFTDQMSLYLGGEEIRFVHPLPSAHTDGDGVVWFTKEHVVHMGDELFAGMYPFVDIDSGGNVLGIADAVDKVVALVPADTKFIAGHGPVFTAAQMKEYSAFLRDCAALVQVAMKQGKTLEQMKADNVLAKYDKMNGFIKSPQFTEFVYKSITVKTN